MSRSAVEIEIIFLHVLAVIAFAVGQAEEPFLEDRILAVPQCQRKTEDLVVIGDSGEAVFAPTIRPRACLVVAEVVPRIAVLTVILPHGAPLPLAQIGAPSLPIGAIFR